MRSERGFSLIEVVIATVVFMVVVLIVGSYYPTASLSGRIGRNVTIATSLADQKMANLRAMAFNSVAGSSGSTAIGGVSFSWTVTVCNPPSAAGCSGLPAPCSGGGALSDTKLTKICVQVTWTDQGSTTARTVSRVTFIQGYY
ncbi:MAG TPA: prepilin-type N-terminal cleavage/methylation domain-containing protein [bacterium]